MTSSAPIQPSSTVHSILRSRWVCAATRNPIRDPGVCRSLLVCLFPSVLRRHKYYPVLYPSCRTGRGSYAIRVPFTSNEIESRRWSCQCVSVCLIRSEFVDARLDGWRVQKPFCLGCSDRMDSEPEHRTAATHTV